jgi:hypothetical protein
VVDAVHKPGGQARQSLVRAHHVEVGVNPETEGLRYLAKHLLMLASSHDGAMKVVGVAQRGHHRGKLDRLRTGPHEDQDVTRCSHDPLRARFISGSP